MKFLPILKCLLLGLFLATLVFMVLVRVDESLAGVVFFVLWPVLSFGFWYFRRRQPSVPAKAKPQPRPTNWARLLITAALAVVLSATLAFVTYADLFGIALIPLWIALYYGWPHLARHFPFLDFDKTPGPVPTRPLWLRFIRGTLATVGAIFLALLICVSSFVVVPIALCERRAQKVANSVHVGMSVQEVLDTARDCDSFHAGSEFPWDKNADSDNNIPAMGLSWRRDGTYVTYDLAAGQDLALTEAEAIQRLHTKLHDGYKWRFSYTYTNVTPMHISFSVIFGPDGRVAEVTHVHGWD